MKNLYPLILIIFIYACSNSSEPKIIIPSTPIDSSFVELIPLQTGNYWLYEYHHLNKDGSVRDIVNETYGFIVSDSLETNFNNENIIAKKLSRYYPSKIDTNGYYLYNNKWGTNLIAKEKEGEITNYNLLLFNNPNKDTTSNSVPLFYLNCLTNSYSFQDTVTYTLITKDTLISTPYGNYNCYLYYSKLQSLPWPSIFRSYYHFIKPGLGIVQMITKFEYPPDTTKHWSKINYLRQYSVNGIHDIDK